MGQSGFLRTASILLLVYLALPVNAQDTEDKEWARSVSEEMTFEKDDDGGIYSPEGGDASRVNKDTTGIEPESEEEDQLLESGEDSYGEEGKLEDIGRDTSNEWEADSPDTSSGEAFDVVSGSMSSSDGTREIESHGCTIDRIPADQMTYDPDAPKGNRVKGDDYKIDEDTCQESYTGKFNSQCELQSETFECTRKDNKEVVRSPVNVKTKNKVNVGFDAVTGKNQKGPVEYHYQDNVSGYKDRMRWKMNIPVSEYPDKSKLSIVIEHGNRIRFEGDTNCSGSTDCTTTINNLTGDRESDNGMGGPSYKDSQRGYKRSRLIGYDSSASFSEKGVVSLWADHHDQLYNLSKDSQHPELTVKSIKIVYNGDFDDSKYERGDLEKCSNRDLLEFGELCDDYEELKLTADVARQELDPLWEADPQKNVCWEAGIESVCERQVEETDPELDAAVEGAWDEQAVEEEFLKMAGDCTTEEVTKESSKTTEYTEEGFCTVPQDMEIEGCSINRNIELDSEGNIITDEWEGSNRCKDLMSKIEDYEGTCEFNLDYNEPDVRNIDGHEVMTCDYAENQADVNEMFSEGYQAAGFFPSAQAATSGSQCPDSHPIEVTEDIASSFDHLSDNDIGKCAESAEAESNEIASFENLKAGNITVNLSLVKDHAGSIEPGTRGRVSFTEDIHKEDDINIVKDESTFVAQESEYIHFGDKLIAYPGDFDIEANTISETGSPPGDPRWDVWNAADQADRIEASISLDVEYYKDDGGVVFGNFSYIDEYYSSDIDITFYEGEETCPSGYKSGNGGEYECLSEDLEDGTPPCDIYENLKDHGYPGNKITERVEVSQISCGADSLKAQEEVCNDEGECVEPGDSLGAETENTCEEYNKEECTQISDECVNEVEHPLGGTHCVEREKRYECEIKEEHTNEVTMDEYECGDDGDYHCMDGSCVESSDSDDGGGFGEAAARITAAEGIASHTECADPDDPTTCRVFGGEAVACREGSGALADLWNCCDVASSGSGTMGKEDWAKMAINSAAFAAGTALGGPAAIALMAASSWEMASQFMTLLISCHEEEFQLAHAKQVDQATYIGKRCGDRMSVGFDHVCVRRDYHYCKFDSLMSKVIMEQAMGQLNRSMGTADNPNCEGMTIDQVTNLDWDEINLDEWEAQLRESDMLDAPSMGDDNTDSSLPDENPGDAPNWD